MDFKVFVEIPAGGNIKYEIDEKTGELTVDRFLHTAFTYPFNYGFIKDTKAEDGDAVDVIVLSSYPVQAGVVMKCHAIGMLEMEDEEGIDNKVVVVPDVKVDPEYGELTDITEVKKPIMDKIKHFFEQYKTLEPGKWVKVKSYKGKEAAEAEIKKSSKQVIT